jgi:hypothetical protein
LAASNPAESKTSPPLNRSDVAQEYGRLTG